jgi:site-specific DNA-methyltransferase (adenine-specific)
LRLVRVRARQATAEAEALSTPEDGTSFNQVYLGAAEAILAQLPDTTFDVCITDPPWLVFKDENLTHDVETLPVFKELYRVMKFPSFLLMFVGIDDLIFYRRELPRIGWAVSKVPAIWHKPGVQTMGDDSWQYSRDFEFILVAAKGKPAFTFSKQKSALFSFPPVPPPKMIHPNEKPMGLLVELLRDTSYEGACFIDPFAGSGCHLHAARTLNRRWVGIERDSASYEKILERLEK